MTKNSLETALTIASERRELTDRLKKILIERLSLPYAPEEISVDAPLFGTGLGLDSIEALEIVIGVENEFGVSIGDDDLQAFRSLNTIADFINAKQYSKQLEAN